MNTEENSMPPKGQGAGRGRMRDFFAAMLGIATCAASFCGIRTAHAQATTLAGDLESEPEGYWNWKTKTLGGQQFWTDFRHLNGWRIQKNVSTEHFRLIDPSNVRHAWGNKAHCFAELNRIAVERNLQSPKGRVIILLHGLIRTGNSMSAIQKYLAEHTNATIVNFSYASTRAEMAQHANALAELIENLGPEVTRIDFVGHSMGNIVVRHYLGDLESQRARNKTEPVFGRMVMLGPPNHGSKMARLLNNSLTFNSLTGTCGMQLGKGWANLEKKLATPSFEFAIISGGSDGDRLIDNWALSGPNDFTVDATETRLDGAADFIVQPLYHGTMMKNSEVHQEILNFLEFGYLVSPDKRQPIPKSSQVKELR